ncbi:C-type natriuretic peptide [Ascaphus truei]|uniref:C-type natriuretic peptide n=1 Tax=Ascaphus truei TaxID=8439 RepID=UPI003F5A3716
MHFSHFLAWGLLLAVLCVRMEAKPTAQAQKKFPSGLVKEDLAEYLDAGYKGDIDPENHAGLVQNTKRPRSFTRNNTASVQPRNSESNTDDKKKNTNNCFGLKLDRIGTASGLGC